MSNPHPLKQQPQRRQKIMSMHDTDAVIPAVQFTNGSAVRAEWDDPNDTGRRGTYTRMVHGYRRSDPLITLHRRSPREFTDQHLRAAERLRDDYEISEGVSLEKGQGGEAGPLDVQLDARARYRGAVQAVGPRLCTILLPVVLSSWTVKRWAEERDMSETKAAGYLIASLDRLQDHYNPVVRKSA